jgi:protein ERP2
LTKFQVIDGGDGQLSEMDINFKLLSPRGHPIVAEFRKSEGTHSHHGEELGDYKICFDNTFSYVSSKTVYFEILNENEDEDYDDLKDIFGEEEMDAEYYEVSVAEIEVSRGNKIRNTNMKGSKFVITSAVKLCRGSPGRLLETRAVNPHVSRRRWLRRRRRYQAVSGVGDWRD